MITRSRYSRKCSGSTSSASASVSHDVVRRHRAVAVHEMVQVAGREPGLRGERAVRDARLVHQPLDRRRRTAPRDTSAASPSRYTSLPSSATCTRRSSPVGAIADIDRAVLEALLARPSRGPGSRSGRRRRTSRPGAGRGRRAARPSPASESTSAACSPISSAPVSTTTWTSYGASAAGQTDPVLVVALLDERRHHARRADAVAAHDQRLLLSVLVEERRAERLRVARAELEDVADLDRRLELQRAAAVRDSGRPRPARAGRRSAASKSRPASTPRRCQPLRFAPATNWPSRSVSSATTSPLNPTGPSEPPDRAERSADLLVGRRPRRARRAQRRASPARAGRRRGRARARPCRRPSSPASPSRSPRRRSPRNVGERLARRHARRLDLSRAPSVSGKTGARGTPRATSRSAAKSPFSQVTSVFSPEPDGREEVDRLAAAHHPRLGLDVVVLEPAALEDPVVRASCARSSARALPRRGRTSTSPS